MRILNLIGIGLCSLLMLSACTTQQDTSPTLLEVEAYYDAENDKHLFRVNTDTIPSGWTTIRLKNGSPVVHFAFLDGIPGDRTSEDMHEEILPVFQEAAYLLDGGKPDEAMAAFGNMPPWFGEIVFMGGTGFISPGMSTETTLFLTPGNYMLECYIKNEESMYHWNMGMYLDLHVTADTTAAQAPEKPNISITTTDEGLQIEGEAMAGENLVAVHFEEENPMLLRRDVHVIEVTEDTDPEAVEQWIDFNNIGALISTPENPGPATFLGGAHDQPKGFTSYFKLNLEAGKEYAWVTEQSGDRFEYITFSTAEE